MVELSVVLPVYNDERFISKSIRSILNQTFTEFEFIIVDDGSTDNTRKIVDDYARKDSRIEVIHQSNKGEAIARNIAIQIAKGKYIAMQDSDDLSLPNRLEEQLMAIKDLNRDLLATDFYVVDEGDNVIVENAKKRNMITSLLIGSNPICHGTILFKREKILEIGGYNSFYKISPDFDLYLRLIDHKGKISKLDKTLYKYRLRKNSTITGKSSQSYFKRAFINHIRRNKGLVENFSPVSEKTIKLKNPYQGRFAGSIFWGEDYSKYISFYLKNFFLLLPHYEYSVYFLYSIMPDTIKKAIKEWTIKKKIKAIDEKGSSLCF